MKFKTILFLLVLTFQFPIFAHEHFFSFAEMEYNSTTSKFETSIIATTHDIEHFLIEKGYKIKELEDYYSNDSVKEIIENELLKGFKVSIGNKKINFKLKGYEVKNTGETYFYFESDKVDKIADLHVVFDLLMEHDKRQQNKLTYIFQNKKTAYSFTTSKKEQDILIENSSK